MKLITTSGRGSSAGRKRLEALLAHRSAAYERVMPAVRRIVEGMRKGGDAALSRYAVRFDGNKLPSQLQISPEEMHNALEAASPAFVRALRAAKTREEIWTLLEEANH